MPAIGDVVEASSSPGSRNSRQKKSIAPGACPLTISGKANAECSPAASAAGARRIPAWAAISSIAIGLPLVSVVRISPLVPGSNEALRVSAMNSLRASTGSCRICVQRT
jgi:hypothetical protein